VAGIVVRDRETGAVWRNANSQTHIWGCSILLANSVSVDHRPGVAPAR
jgi:hypothetical protein